MKKPASEAAGVVRNTQMRLCPSDGMVDLEVSKTSASACQFESGLGHHYTLIRGNNMELKKMLVENRITQLRRKDPVRNAAIIRKNERILRKLNQK